MGEIRVIFSVAALLALFILSPEPLLVKAFSAYFQLGIIISISVIVWIFAVVLQYRGYGKLIRSTIWYIVTDPPSVFVGLMLAIYLVAVGLNFIIFWLVLLVAGLLEAIGGRGRKKGQPSYQALFRADRKPGFLSEQFLFPMATISSCAAIFILALADAEIDYRSVFWILLVATTVRLVGYSASDMSPRLIPLSQVAALRRL